VLGHVARVRHVARNDRLEDPLVVGDVGLEQPAVAAQGVPREVAREGAAQGDDRLPQLRVACGHLDEADPGTWSGQAMPRSAKTS
jgi:hypothetical protein